MRWHVVRLLALLSLCLAVRTVAPVQAQVPAVSYAPGWNLAGGPRGMDFSAASAVVAYRNGDYVSVAPTADGSCNGAWAYFPAATSVTVPASTASSQTCTLSAGWNLVADPFDVPALLPPGVVGERWDTEKQAYVLDSGIAPGGASWIYAETAQTLALTAAAEGGLTIALPPAQTQAYQIHVGEYLTVLVSISNGTPGFDARADATHLQPAGSGPTGPLAAPAYYYRWKAIATGSTTLTLDPACLKSGCETPSLAVSLDILP